MDVGFTISPDDQHLRTAAYLSHSTTTLASRRDSRAAASPRLPVGISRSNDRVYWREVSTVFADGFESGDTAAWSLVVP